MNGTADIVYELVQVTVTRDEEEAGREWLKTCCPKRWDGVDLDTWPNGGLLEALMWELIVHLEVSPDYDAEQWVRITTKGFVDTTPYKLEVEADSFLLAAAESVRWWREKRGEEDR